jgi:uncharacterized phage protein (TIGR02216 family)
MRLGLGILRLPPDAFWRLSPRELMAAAGPLVGGDSEAALVRTDLSRLMARYPDRIGVPHGRDQ